MQKNYLRSMLCAVLLGVSFTLSYAQNGSISGTVVDEKKETLPGVSVVIQGTTQGGSADLNGKYKISGVAPGKQIIVASFIGYKAVTKEINVIAGQDFALDFTLEEDAVLLTEAVAIGYGTTQRRDITGTVTKVDAKNIERMPVQSINAALQGKAAGLQVTQQNGAVGSATRVRLRGQTSISASGDPLYVIDGVPVTQNDLSTKGLYGSNSAIPLDPLSSIPKDNIESIVVLKDASAAAIYGTRAANGVILITTKRGKSGVTKFNFNAQHGFSTPAHKLEILDGNQWRDAFYKAYQNDSTLSSNWIIAHPGLPGNQNPYNNWDKFPTSLNGVNISKDSFLLDRSVNTNWYDQVFRTGNTSTYNLTASGGNEKTRFLIGGGYDNTDGMLVGNNYESLNGRLNLDNTVNKNLTIGGSIGLTRTENNQVSTSYNGGLGAAQSNALPVFPVYNADGTYFGTQLASPSTDNNPTANLEDKYKTTIYRSLCNLYTNLDFWKNFTWHNQFGLDVLNQHEEFYFSPINRYYLNRPLGAAQERRVVVTNWNYNTTLSYDKTFAKKHELKVLIGTEIQNSQQKDIGFYPVNDAVGFRDNYFTQSSSQMDWASWAATSVKQGSPVGGYNSQNQYRFWAGFARINYIYNKKYQLTVIVRNDGSSKFGPDNRYAVFPAVSAGWVISEEKFMQNIKWLSFLQLKGGYGITGTTPAGNYLWHGSYSSNGAGGYINTQGFSDTKIPNPTLSWEQTKEYDASLVFGFLKNRIYGTFNYYSKRSANTLLTKAVQQSATGFSSLTVNSGVIVSNKGYEFEITSHNIEGNNFTWTTDFNIASNKNNVVSADGIPPDGFGFDFGDTRIIEGQPLGVSYIAQYAGVDPQTGLELIYDSNGQIVPLTATTSPATQQTARIAVGKPFPDYFGGITNTFTYKGFEFSFLFTFSHGNTIYDDGAKYQFQLTRNGGYTNPRSEIQSAWTTPGEQTDVPVLTLHPYNPDQNNTTRFLYDASYTRLKSVELSYSLPSNICTKVKMETIRIYVAATNLLTITKFKGWDPEVTRYADATTETGQNQQGNISFAAPYLPTPQAKTLTFGINLNF